MRSPLVTRKRAQQLRRELTPPEVALWSRLRRNQLGGLKFRRQHPFGPYILDFYCAPARLALEIDGAIHDRPAQSTHDARRDAFLEQQGVQTLRLSARLIRGDMADVLRMIHHQAAARTQD